MKYTLFLSALILLLSCKENKSDKNSKVPSQAEIAYKKAIQRNLKNTIEFEAFDQFGHTFSKGLACQINETQVLVPLQKVKGSFSAKFTYPASDVKPITKGYTHYDFGINLVALNIAGSKHTAVPISESSDKNGNYAFNKTESGIKKIKLTISKSFIHDSILVWSPIQTLPAGTSVFSSEHKLIGVYNSIRIENQDSIVILPMVSLQSFLQKIKQRPLSIGHLRLKTDKIYPKREKVKAFKMTTTSGTIVFKVYNDMGLYEDNLIKLCSDGYYDSLLIHRVIHNFLIQTGAADSRTAEKGDVLGWKGPGYTLPTQINAKYFHKRGALAASKPPEYKNPKNRTDGAQFYIIGGRTFSSDELDDLEETKSIQFTKQQRDFYSSKGGAPYLDGDYVVFGEVISGMSVVDKISKYPADSKDRPLLDVRINKLEIVY